MFMHYGQGFPLKPLKGEWFVHRQPNNWQDTDDFIHGIYNHDITISGNIPADTKMSIVMKAGDDVIHRVVKDANRGFTSYPMTWSDDTGTRPSGIPTNLADLEFIETPIIVREKEYYDQKPPITVTITFEQGQSVYTRTYTLKLTWDNYFSNRPNELVVDLMQIGVPFLPKYKGWEGWQPITGEYLYTRHDPVPTLVEYNGFWVGCFASIAEATLKFPAFELMQHKGIPYVHTHHSISAALDLCLAGIEATHRNSGFPNGNFSSIRIKQDVYYLLPSVKGTFIFEAPVENHGFSVFFFEGPLTAHEFTQLLQSVKWELRLNRNYRTDPLGHHRAQIGSHIFWEVLELHNPPPAFGGTSAGVLPQSFMYGVMEYIARFPQWWMRIGTFPVLA